MLIWIGTSIALKGFHRLTFESNPFLDQLIQVHQNKLPTGLRLTGKGIDDEHFEP